MLPRGSLRFVCFVVLWFGFFRSAGGTQRRNDEDETEGTIRIRSLYGNWCQYTVWRTVSYLTYNGTATVSRRLVGSCHGLYRCPKFLRTFVRPMYRLSYRQFTTSEWRCCPGFHGDDCQQESEVDVKTLRKTVELGSGCLNCTNPSQINLRLHKAEGYVRQTKNDAIAPLQSVSQPPMRTAYKEAAKPRLLINKPYPIGLPGYLGLAVPRGRYGSAVSAGPLKLSRHLEVPGQNGSPGLKGEAGKIETEVLGLKVELKLLAQRVLLLESKISANDVHLESGSGSDSLQDGSWLDES